MSDRFRGRVWIFWAQFLILAPLGLFGIFFGILFWIGAFTDANGEARPQAGPPMVIIGTGLIVVAAMAVFNIAARMSPIIRCYRDGIECNLVGATALNGVPLIPGFVRVVWAVLSLQGFRTLRVRIPWPRFDGAEVVGLPMAYVLVLHGKATNMKTGQIVNGVSFSQAALTTHPQEVAEILNRFAGDMSLCERLPEWSGQHLPDEESN